MRRRNEIEINAESFAFDGCHKIYIIEDDEDLKKAKEMGYNIYCIDKLPEIYENSCSLRFIDNWKLDKTFSKQFEKAKIIF